ncbi:MAG: phage baseplate assembly protein V [Deltaproteobacteria bacterium]|jgi:phage baseplate assembly protein V|nr:phage baseplate assembly protein V [Deltaproteobacteria bacterium]
MGAESLADLLAQVIRVGFVVARDEQKMRVRVEFPDTVSGPLTTDYLQVLVPRAKQDCVYDLPDYGDQVLCLFLPHGKEEGFVLGSMYGADAPPVGSGDKWHRTFADGTVLEYDRAAHVLLADVQGRAKIKTTESLEAEIGTFIKASAGADVTVEAKGKIAATAPDFISLTATHIDLNGNVTSGGSGGSGGRYRATDNADRIINGFLVVTGSVDIQGDLTTRGNSSTSGNSFASTRSGGDLH